jgi:hypothetical protein
MATEKEFKSFAEFWPFYVSEHSNPTSRRLHFIGTTLVILILLIAIFVENAWLLIALPIFGYGFAWVGHFFFQKNKPATFIYPLWSLRGDFKMYGYILTGRMNQEIAKAEEWLKHR